MTDPIPEDVYEAGLGSGLEVVAEAAAPKSAAALWIRIAIYGILSVAAVGTVVGKAAPNLLTSVVESFPNTLGAPAKDG